MRQCFVRKNKLRPFPGGVAPKLLYVSKIESEDSIYPRTLHAHDNCAEIILICSGSGYYSIDGKRYLVQEGDLVFLNSGVLHDEMSDSNTLVASYCCAIGDLAMEGLPVNVLVPADAFPVVPCGDRFETIRKLFELLFELLLTAKTGADETCHFLMMSLLTQVQILLEFPVSCEVAQSEYREEGLGVLGFRIKGYIDEHYHEDIGLQSIAEELNISPYYLAHVFKEGSGYSPVNYILRRRIGEAQTLLINTDDNVTQISSLVGYDNPSHFNFIFTKHVGMSPLKYRKSYTVKSETNSKAKSNT
ncbi:MAG: transcriptional regulator [Bacillota bacterium]|nr:transcriptional regulator [Bacillota bacterium]